MIPCAYAPAASDRAFWNGLDWSRLSGTLGVPTVFVQPTFHAVYVTCAMAWHTSFFLYPHFGRNLAFVCSVPSDPHVLFLEPRFCFISYVRPLCFSAVHLLCTIFIFCFLFQVMHVIFLLVLQYGNQLRLLPSDPRSNLLTSL